MVVPNIDLVVMSCILLVSGESYLLGFSVENGCCTYWSLVKIGSVKSMISWFVLHTEDVGDEGEEEKECITYNVSIDIHYGIKSNR